MSRAIAVATCSPTMKARYGDSDAATLRSVAQLPPTMAGSRTLCPRLEIGNSSVTPWIRPTTAASRYVRWVIAAFQRCGSWPARCHCEGVWTGAQDTCYGLRDAASQSPGKPFPQKGLNWVRRTAGRSWRGARGDLGAETDQRTVPAAHHALRQRDQRVVGDLESSPGSRPVP